MLRTILTILTLSSGAVAAEPVYVTASDSSRFSPAGALSVAAFPGKWYLRQVAFAARGDYLLMAYPGGLYPDLTVNPGLRGRYNIYVNLREVNYLTGLQLKLSGRDLAYTVTPAPGTVDVHTNRDILVAVDVPLDGQTLLLRHIGRLVYFSYLKFVPTADEPNVQVDPERIREEPLLDVRQTWKDTRDVTPEGFVEIKHLSPPPADPALEDPRGYVLFTRSCLDLTFPDTLPSAAAVASDLRLSAARGEYEPLSFAVRATRDLGPCRVTVDDLRDGNKRLAKANIAIASVQLRRLRTTFNGKLYVNVPASLDPVQPVTVTASQTKQFWLTIHVPDSTAPGDYRGTVTFTPQNAAPVRLPLSVRVYPFALREAPGVFCGFYDRLFAMAADGNWLRDRFADLRAHGLTTIAYCGGLNAEITNRDGHAAIVFNGKGGLEQVMDAYRDAGFTNPLMWMMTDEFWQYCAAQAEPDSPEFNALYQDLTKSLLAESKKRRWPGLIFQPNDEPGSYELRPNAFYLQQWAVQSQLLKKAGAVVEVDHIPFTTNDERLKAPLARALPNTDIFTQRFSNKPIWFLEEDWWWNKMKDQAASWQKQLWSYNINDAAFFPELATYRLAFGHFLSNEGVNGQLMWSFGDPIENPYNALDGAYTDMLYIYPACPQAGDNGGPTLMYESIREGRDDHRYLYTLKSLLEAARAARPTPRLTAAIQQAEQTLSRLQASFDKETLTARNRFLECQWDASAILPTGEHTATGAFNVPNGWSLSDYDRWRTELARQIIALQQAK